PAALGWRSIGSQARLVERALLNSGPLRENKPWWLNAGISGGTWRLTCFPDSDRQTVPIKSALMGVPSASLYGRPNGSAISIAGSRPKRQKIVAARSAGPATSATG